jgi:hypothetical protein
MRVAASLLQRIMLTGLVVATPQCKHIVLSQSQKQIPMMHTLRKQLSVHIQYKLSIVEPTALHDKPPRMFNQDTPSCCLPALVVGTHAESL